MKTILVDAVNTFVNNGKIFLEMKDLLDSYSNEKIILTNADDEQIKEFDLVNLPYKLFTLKHQPNKIDPKYFELMLENFNLKKEDVIYFEHNLEAVKSAQSLGINTFHYNKDKKDLTTLKEFLDSNIN